MNKKAKQLREIRNKLIYNNDVPLEKGCEMEYKETIKALDNTNNGIYTIVNNDDGYIEAYTFERGFAHCGWFEQERILKNNIKILGKPTSWGDVLRMLNKKENELGWYVLESNGRLMFFYDYKDCSAKEITTFDLTKEPEQQNEEVLDKLLEILK